MFFSIICSLFYVSLISQLCNSQNCTTKKSKSCIFPFEYQNQTYNGCSIEIVKAGRSWCSIKVDGKQQHVTGKLGITWDFCSSDCPVDRNPNIKSKQGSHFEESNNLSKYDTDDQNLGKKLVDSINNNKGKMLWSKTPPITTAPPLTHQVPMNSRLTFTSPTPPTAEDQINICSETKDYPGTYLPVPTLGQCGKLCSTGRLFGGINAKLGEFPWAVLIGHKVIKRRKTYPEQKWERYWATEYKCGGTLINSRFVLTAAHCHGYRSKISSVVLGEWEVGVDPDCPYGNKHPDSSCKPKKQVIEVESIVIHEDYRDNKINGGGLVNDIALLRLKKHAHLNEAVQPICLPLNQEEAAKEIGAGNIVEGIVGRNATVIGWGATKKSERTINVRGVAHDILQKVDLTIYSNEYCQSKLNDLAPDLNIQETHFCAGSHTRRDSCNGDSGGGMFINKELGEKTDDTSYQIGIVSFGMSNCGIGYPGVYTRISEFIPWIKENIYD